jgi:hypothetical protein
MSFQVPLTLRPVWRFAVHVVIGSFAFLIVYMVAVGVERSVDWTASLGAPQWMVDEARTISATIFWLDLFGLALFLLTETIKLCRHIILRDWED